MKVSTIELDVFHTLVLPGQLFFSNLLLYGLQLVLRGLNYDEKFSVPKWIGATRKFLYQKIFQPSR